jgi:hypothetical protein
MSWLWTKLRGRRFTSPELEQAGIIFRLERHGVPSARLLAFGQTQFGRWQYESFVLIEDRKGTSLGQWLAALKEDRWTAQRKTRWAFLRRAGTLLRQMHQAQCYLSNQSDRTLVVENAPGKFANLILVAPERIQKRRRSSLRLSRKNLRALVRILGLSNLSRTDRMRILLSYTGQKHITAYAKKLAADVML